MQKLILVLLLLSCSYSASAVENYRYFIDSQSVSGPTGNIYVPSTKVLPHSMWSFGLHRFVVGLNYGILKYCEAGISLDLKEMTPLFPLDSANIDRKSKEISIHSKYRILREEEHPIDISFGQRRSMFYLTASKYFSDLWDTTFQGGITWESNKLLSFFSLNRMQSGEQLIFDYDPASDSYNFGMRFLVSPEMKIDFFFIDLKNIRNIFFDNFMFGITLVG